MKIDTLIALTIVGVLLIITPVIIMYKINTPEYIYVARGIQCKEYDKDSNVLKKCDDSQFGEVEIINPIAVLKIRIK